MDRLQAGNGIDGIRSSRDEGSSSRLSEAPASDLNYNYLGQFDQTLSDRFRLAEESSGPDFSPRLMRSSLLEIVAAVVGGQLRVEWVYSEKVHDRATIDRLAAAFREELRRLIGQCRAELSFGAEEAAEFGWLPRELARITDAIRRV